MTVNPKETGEQLMMVSISADQFGQGGINMSIPIRVVGLNQSKSVKNEKRKGGMTIKVIMSHTL